MSLCAPALFYLILSILAISYMIYERYNAFSIFMKVIFITIWTWILNLLCEKGYEAISWFLVILPFIFIILFFAIFLSFISKMNSQNKQNIHHNMH